MSTWRYPQVLAPHVYWLPGRGEARVRHAHAAKSKALAMAASSMISSSPLVAPTRARGLPPLGRTGSSFAVVCGTGKKIKTDKPFGIGGGLTVDTDASGRKVKGKGVYQFVDKYGANVDGYSPIFAPEEWSPGGDVYVGGTTGLLIWAVTLAGLLGGGALLVYNTSALAS